MSKAFRVGFLSVTYAGDRKEAERIGKLVQEGIGEVLPTRCEGQTAGPVCNGEVWIAKPVGADDDDLWDVLVRFHLGLGDELLPAVKAVRAKH